MRPIEGEITTIHRRTSCLPIFLYHEVLHQYIRDITGPGKGQPMHPTPLVSRYADDVLYTRTHLHLIAIQRLVYQRLGKPQIPVAVWSDFQDPAYIRSYRLANALGRRLPPSRRSDTITKSQTTFATDGLPPQRHFPPKERTAPFCAFLVHKRCTETRRAAAPARKSCPGSLQPNSRPRFAMPALERWLRG